jgi:hypothetical protein
MTKFLTGRKLEEKLTDIIWEAKQHVVIMSPFIKLDEHVKSIFDKIKASHEVYLILLFGKNEGYKQKSFNKSDFEYFKEFKNIAILYHKDLHAKHYCNEKGALITSLNLYDYSMVNNIEYGVYFTKNILNPAEKLFDETFEFTDELIFEKSDLVFLKRPQYKKKMLGLSKTYQDSAILYDISESFFKGRKYEEKKLNDFDYEKFSDLDRVYDVKPKRKDLNKGDKSSDEKRNDSNSHKGFCIRCKTKIKYDTERPYCWDCYSVWAQFENPFYEENVCHSCSKPVGVTMDKPVCYGCYKKDEK